MGEQALATAMYCTFLIMYLVKLVKYPYKVYSEWQSAGASLFASFPVSTLILAGGFWWVQPEIISKILWVRLPAVCFLTTLSVCRHGVAKCDCC